MSQNTPQPTLPSLSSLDSICLTRFNTTTSNLITGYSQTLAACIEMNQNNSSAQQACMNTYSAKLNSIASDPLFMAALAAYQSCIRVDNTMAPNVTPQPSSGGMSVGVIVFIVIVIICFLFFVYYAFVVGKRRLSKGSIVGGGNSTSLKGEHTVPTLIRTESTDKGKGEGKVEL